MLGQSVVNREESFAETFFVVFVGISLLALDTVAEVVARKVCYLAATMPIEHRKKGLVLFEVGVADMGVLLRRG